jgi:hypothetical protein
MSPEMKSEEDEEEQYNDMDSASDDSLRWDDAIRVWPGNDNRGMPAPTPCLGGAADALGLDGYISFPDFERYSQSSDDGREPEPDPSQSPKT